MSDTNTATGPEAIQPPPQATPHPPFPFVRLFYAIGFGVIAYFVLHVLFALAFVQFFLLAINGRVNEEMKSFSLNLVQYLWELGAFIVFARDEPPFPFGPFPKHS